MSSPDSIVGDRAAAPETGVEKVRRADERPSVCLSMIVKDEAHVIRRCINSVRPLVDAWAIVDTGSSDKTRDIIREALADLPGALYERPWRDFGHNRTEALELARPWADYALIIDADETLEMPAGYRLPRLCADAYLTPHCGSKSTSSFSRVQLARSDKPWRYVGVLHEVIVCDEPHRKGRIDELMCVGHFDSARNVADQKEKYTRDAEVLEKALEDEPGNERYVFYLAQSYRDAGNDDDAIANYRRRAAMGGWPEEVWYSLYQVGLLAAAQGDFAVALEAHLRAYQCRPTRAEPLCTLAKVYRLREEFHLAYLFARRAVEITKPDDLLFINDSVYEWRAFDELSIAAYWIGSYRESFEAAERVLRVPTLPADQRERIEKNRTFAAQKLAAEKRSSTSPKPRGRAKPAPTRPRRRRGNKSARKR